MDSEEPIKTKEELFDNQAENDDNPAFGALQTERDVAHHHLFGRHGHLQALRSTGHSWQRKPFKRPCHLKWRIPLSTAHLLRLIHGFRPVEMEDKWFIYADGPDVRGDATLHFHRGWTGDKVAQLEIKVSWGDDGAAEEWTGEIVELVMEGEVEEAADDDTVEEMTKFQVLEACRWVLGVQLVDEIKEPKEWEALANKRVVSEPITEAKELYRGSSITQETVEDLKRLQGSRIEVVFS